MPTALATTSASITRPVCRPPPACVVKALKQAHVWPMKRGRLNQIKRWASAAKARTTTFAAYDVFGPTQVQDPAGGMTIYTRAGGACRVTRIDTADGRHTSTRYYDGNLPRLQLLNGGVVGVRTDGLPLPLGTGARRAPPQK